MKTTIERMENIHHGGNRHFVITKGNKKYFQSYNTLIAIVDNGRVTLNRNYWNCSKTTSAYLNRFLGVSQKEKIEKMRNGEYKLRILDSNILYKLNPYSFR